MLVQTQDEKLSDNSMHEAQFNGYSKQMWTKFWCCVTSDHKITVHACTLVYIYTRTYPPVDGVDNTQVWKGQGGTSENKVQRAGRQECLGSFKHNLNNKTHNNCWCYNNRMSVFKSSNKRHPQLLVFFKKKMLSKLCVVLPGTIPSLHLWQKWGKCAWRIFHILDTKLMDAGA